MPWKRSSLPGIWGPSGWQWLTTIRKRCSQTTNGVRSVVMGRVAALRAAGVGQAEAINRHSRVGAYVGCTRVCKAGEAERVPRAVVEEGQEMAAAGAAGPPCFEVQLQEKVGVCNRTAGSQTAGQRLLLRSPAATGRLWSTQSRRGGTARTDWPPAAAPRRRLPPAGPSSLGPDRHSSTPSVLPHESTMSPERCR